MRTSTKLAVAIALATLGLTLPSAAAQASPFSMSIDNAILDLGSLKSVRAIDSALEPPDPPATIAGDVTGGDVEVPKTGFVFPTKNAEVSPGINANIDMEANEDITGDYDEETGQLVLNVNLKATVAVLTSSCVISPIVLELRTSNARPYLGRPFTEGLEGVGVVSASWSALPPVTGGGFCGTVAGLTAGPGGIAMSHGVHDFKTCATDGGNPLCDVVVAPEKAPTLNSAPSSSTDKTTASFSFAKGSGETQPVEGFECALDGGTPEPCGTGESGTKEYSGLSLGAHTFTVKAKNSVGAGPATTFNWTVTEAQNCPDGETGTPPNCQKPGGQAKLGALKIQPKSKVLKRGKSVVVKVSVKNAGDAAATGVKVCVTAPKKRVQVKKCLSAGQVTAGGTKVLKFKVKAKRQRGKAVLKFKATSSNAGNKSGKATLRIK